MGEVRSAIHAMAARMNRDGPMGIISTGILRRFLVDSSGIAV
jgi:hypothetical protein